MRRVLIAMVEFARYRSACASPVGPQGRFSAIFADHPLAYCAYPGCASFPMLCTRPYNVHSVFTLGAVRRLKRSSRLLRRRLANAGSAVAMLVVQASAPRAVEGPVSSARRLSLVRLGPCERKPPGAGVCDPGGAGTGFLLQALHALNIQVAVIFVSRCRTVLIERADRMSL